MSRAFVIGGSGQIGHALVERLVGDGWDVTVGTRGSAERQLPGGAAAVKLDRTIPGALSQALDGTYDQLVDVMSMTESDARELISVQGRVGSIVALSSMSVYQDDAARTLDEATGVDSFPVLPVPIPTSWSTVAAGPDTYSTNKVAMERALLDSASVPVTVLRAGAVYGPHSVAPREWWVVKRVRDGRPVVPLARQGRGVFHQASTANLAELVMAAGRRPGTRVLNAADPDPLSVRDVVLAILEHLGSPAEILLMDGPESSSTPVGLTPWSVPRDVVGDLSDIDIELGPVSLVGYETGVGAALEWLSEIPTEDWEARLSGLAAYGRPLFDYAAEDDYLTSSTVGQPGRAGRTDAGEP